MKITFISNYLNHHQLPFCLEMINNKDVEFKFVATSKVSDERIKLGYVDMNEAYDFVVRSYDNEKETYDLANNSDVVIIGSAPQKYITQRIKDKKLTFRYSERLFKKGFNIRTWISVVKNFSLRERNVYMLCSSAYSAHDFNSSFCYNKKTYKWGYFPETVKYDIKKLLLEKQKNKVVQLLWVGRFIDWKHPERAILVAKKIRELGIDFSLKMVGVGEMTSQIRTMIKNDGLEKMVDLVGGVNYKEVRKYMENSNIILLTSDYNEGWGAVLNEAMNSGCVVIASHAMGSVPFVIKDNYNGLIYNNDDLDTMIEKVCAIIGDKKKQYELGYNAYNTILSTWNAKIASKNLIKLIKSLLNGEKTVINDGPCSVALPISNKKMYNYLMRSANDKKNC